MRLRPFRVSNCCCFLESRRHQSPSCLPAPGCLQFLRFLREEERQDSGALGSAPLQTGRWALVRDGTLPSWACWATWGETGRSSSLEQDRKTSNKYRRLCRLPRGITNRCGKC